MELEKILEDMKGLELEAKLINENNNYSSDELRTEIYFSNLYKTFLEYSNLSKKANQIYLGKLGENEDGK